MRQMRWIPSRTRFRWRSTTLTAARGRLVRMAFATVLAAANAAHFAVDGANGYAEFRSGLLEDSKSGQEVPAHILDFWKAVERDVLQVEEKWKESGNPEPAVQELSGMALWLGGIPTWASNRWADFTDDLPSEESWSVWIDWYEARLAGRVDDPTLEAARVRCRRAARLPRADRSLPGQRRRQLPRTGDNSTLVRISAEAPNENLPSSHSKRSLPYQQPA